MPLQRTNIDANAFRRNLRYRMYPVALVGDVRKVFHQIEVAVAAIDYLRFLWVEDLKDLLSRVCEWRFTRAIFGAGPGPSLLNATLKITLKSMNRKIQSL